MKVPSVARPSVFPLTKKQWPPLPVSIKNMCKDISSFVIVKQNQIWPDIIFYVLDHNNVSSGKQTIHLWEFLKELLLQPDNYSGCIKWVSRADGVFKIEDSSRVARLWGKRKNRPAMNYDKLSRSIRQYYKKGIIKKTEHSKRLVYQFCQPYLWKRSKIRGWSTMMDIYPKMSQLRSERDF